jgi:hypothetical protein
MPLTKVQINKILKDQNCKIDKVVETFDDKKGTNYLCEKTLKIRVKAKKFDEPVDHFNYNTLDDDDDDDTPMQSDIKLEIPQDFFDDKSEFYGLYKIEARPLTKKYKKGSEPVWNLWAESFPHFSFNIDVLDIPGTKDIVTGRNNPYSYYTMFKKIDTFIPSVRFGIYKPFLVSNTSYGIEDGDEYEIIFYDYIVMLTDNTTNSNYLLLSRTE